ncbi:hypothetical protein BABINDRAFT_162585 [Babjeviella inositovora NRRL Y-12698]|uniref:Mediator of RNA polymerase II transcription subunit 7 n=1 Tax=Babjeviella inositovora NRRL Y-12698 TaxID=984486 RepID=A0A1E3QMI9_9ASCO|nr:uncharacterized protein BABINDRAFT_162585 [Babjeviella inositovora NRRL Y-12698]ODQ78926.1 hypothetical protein BABINDRAFT_162585 [Babjeviella inositovora NRRL Y-12698]
MAANGEDDLITSLYPPPPPYYKFFTDENLEKLETGAEPQGDLKFLVPPSPPGGETYRSFGNIWHFEDKIPSLSEMGMVQLYDTECDTSLPAQNTDQLKSTIRVTELKKLLKSLLLNFLELVGILAVSSENFHLKIENIRTIIINIHHLLNEYRPHQSRESLILLLEKQIDSKQSEISLIDKACLDIETKLRDLVRNLAQKPANQVQVKEDDAEVAEPAEPARHDVIARLLQEIKDQ